MSHFTLWTTQLVGVTETQIKEALTELAKQINATVTTDTTMSRFSYHEHVTATLKNKDVPYGIGVRVEKGKLVICGDPWNQEAGFQKMQKLITGYATLHKIKTNAKNQRLPTTIKMRDTQLLLEVG